MEKESKNAAHKIVVVLEGMRYRKAVAKPEMAMANAKDKPRDPVGMLSKFKFVAYTFDGGDVFLSDFFAHLTDVHVHSTGKYKDVRTPNIMK